MYRGDRLLQSWPFSPGFFFGIGIGIETGDPPEGWGLSGAKRARRNRGPARRVGTERSEASAKKPGTRPKGGD